MLLNLVNNLSLFPKVENPVFPLSSLTGLIYYQMLNTFASVTIIKIVEKEHKEKFDTIKLYEKFQ